MILLLKMMVRKFCRLFINGKITHGPKPQPRTAVCRKDF